MAIKKLNVTIEGTSDLICHNGQTADPRNHYAKAMKAVSGKRKKTDADFDQLARIEWFAGLYVGRANKDAEGTARLTLPSHVIESALVGGAKKSKRGVQAKSGLFVANDATLSFPGSPTAALAKAEFQAWLDQVFDNGDNTLTVGVKVGMAKVMRTRPRFSGWTSTFVCEFDDAVLTLNDVREILDDAGRLVGVGDWRPKYGRFTIAELSEVPVIKEDKTAEVAEQAALM